MTTSDQIARVIAAARAAMELWESDANDVSGATHAAFIESLWRLKHALAALDREEQQPVDVCECEICRLQDELTAASIVQQNHSVEKLMNTDTDRKRAEDAEKMLRQWKNPKIRLMVPSKDGFDYYACQIVDVGHSEITLLVQCDAINEILKAAIKWRQTHCADKDFLENERELIRVIDGEKNEHHP